MDDLFEQAEAAIQLERDAQDTCKKDKESGLRQLRSRRNDGHADRIVQHWFSTASEDGMEGKHGPRPPWAR